MPWRLAAPSSSHLPNQSTMHCSCAGYLAPMSRTTNDSSQGSSFGLIAHFASSQSPGNNPSHLDYFHRFQIFRSNRPVSWFKSNLKPYLSASFSEVPFFIARLPKLALLPTFYSSRLPGRRSICSGSTF